MGRSVATGNSCREHEVRQRDPESVWVVPQTRRRCDIDPTASVVQNGGARVAREHTT